MSRAAEDFRATARSFAAQARYWARAARDAFRRGEAKHALDCLTGARAARATASEYRGLAAAERLRGKKKRRSRRGGRKAEV